MKIKLNKQNGYNLIEMIAGLALAALLTTGITVFAMQTVNVTSDSKDRMYAMMQVENAGYWMSRDIQMSGNFTLGENAGFPLQMMRIDIDQNQYEVTYSLNENTIIRSQIKNEEGPVQSVVAQNINTTEPRTNISDTDGMLIFNITSTYGGVDVSRTYKIKPRLDWDS